MNFPFINGNSSNEKFMKKYLNMNTNDKNSTYKTSSVNQLLTSKKENLYPTLTNNTLDNSQTKDNDNIMFKSFKENKVRYSIAKKNTEQKSMLNKKLKRRTLRMHFPRNTIYQIQTLRNLDDYKTVVGINIFKIRVCDFCLAFLSFTSFLCSIVDNEYFIKKTFNYLEKKYGFKIEDLFNKTQEEINLYVTLIQKRKISPVENVFRCLNIISSFLCCIILWFKYYYKIDLLKIEKKISEYKNVFTSGLFHFFIIECIICLISYPPKINKVFYFSIHTVRYIYSFNSIIFLFSFIKLYNIVKIFLMASRYSSRISETICQTYKTNYNILFMIRAEVNSNPIFFCLILFIIYIVISTISLRSFEVFGYDIFLGLNGNKGRNDLRRLINDFWLSIITVTGIGYGDEYPRTNLGRIVVFLSSIFGMFFLGFLIASVSGGIQFNPKEQRAYLKMKKILSKENLHHKSVELIKGILFLRKNGINYKYKLGDIQTLIKERIILFCKVYNDCNNFNNRLYVARFYSIPMVNLIRTMEYKLYENLKSLTKHLSKVDCIDNDLLFLEKRQNKIVERLKNINVLQKKITRFLLENHNNNYLKRNNIKEVGEEEENEEEKEEKEEKEEEEEEEESKDKKIRNKVTFEMEKLVLFPTPTITKSFLSKITNKNKNILAIPKVSARKLCKSPNVSQRHLIKIKNKKANVSGKDKSKKQLEASIIKKLSNKYKFDLIRDIEIKRANSFKSKNLKLHY